MFIHEVWNHLAHFSVDFRQYDIKRGFSAMTVSAIASRLLAGLVLAGFTNFSASATPSLVIDADSGAILSQQEATAPWYPASLTKLMTVYVALKTIRDGRLTVDTPLKVSARATRMPPSKMGFRVGSEVTMDNALKMLMVKSANDIAVTIAESISGSVEAFADAMNEQAARLGMQESHFVNPNGLPSARHVSSARDFALLARALLRDFPEHSDLYGIGALSLNGRTIPTHNGMLGRYPGADGMKTGFTCAAGFNIVASATQRGRRLIAVVMGEPSARARTKHAAELLDAAFGSSGGSGSLAGLEHGTGSAPDMRATACSRKTKGGTWVGEIEDFATPIEQVRMPWDTAPAQTTSSIASLPRPSFDPIPVYLGRAASWTGTVLSASNPAVKQMPSSASAFAPVPKPAPPTATPGEIKGFEPLETDAASPLKPDPNANPMSLVGAVADEAANPKAVKAKAALKKQNASKVKTTPGKVALVTNKVAKPAVAKPAVKKPAKTKIIDE